MAARPARRRAAVETGHQLGPWAGPVRPAITQWPFTPQARDARRRLVITTLQMAALDWEMEDTGQAREAFEEALADFMAEAAPHVTVTPYDYGQSPSDEAYQAIQLAALWLAYIGWGNGRETADASLALDHANDQLDHALGHYAAAASTK